MRDKSLIKEKMEILIKMTAAFCDIYLDEDYKQLCEKLTRKMARKRDVPFLYGRIEIWAASIVYALGTINLLFDKRFEPHITPDTICAYFNTSKSTIYQKSKKIREMFSLKYGDKEFSTPYILEHDPLSHLRIPTKDLVRAMKVLKSLQKKLDKDQVTPARKKDNQPASQQLDLSDFG